jgi:hypothetical protein
MLNRSLPWMFLFIGTLFLSGTAYAQSKKPLDPQRANTVYKFELHPGHRLTLRVRLDDKSTIKTVDVYRENEPTPFQTLPACAYGGPMQLFEGDEQLALVEHADMDFDGYQDIKILTYLNEHLGKKVFCIYVFSAKANQFRFEKQLLIADPIPHPETRQVTSHSEYFGGTFEDSTYEWHGSALVLIAQEGTRDNPKNPECGPVHFSTRLSVTGEMLTTEDDSICSQGRH